MRITSQFKIFRERAGLTQDDVAKVIGIDRSTVAKWESGGTLPLADILPVLAKLYDCTINDLFAEEVQM